MKCVILAGGLGTRLAEETHLRPKPMIEIGGKPILWHILKIYGAYSINEFIVCCGYKGYMIKEYFANYFLHNSDVTFRLGDSGLPEIHSKRSEPWVVTLVDTGETTQTAGRLKRVTKFINKEETFFFTYGDGLANVNIKSLLDHHLGSTAKVTLTAVQPPGRYGAVHMENDIVKNFQEKPDGDNAWISGGFFAVEPNVLDCIDGDDSSWEIDVLPGLASSGLLSAYRHPGFWQPMDTLRDRTRLEELWASGKAPWKIW